MNETVKRVAVAIAASWSTDDKKADPEACALLFESSVDGAALAGSL